MNPNEPSEKDPRAPYVSPALRRLGTVTELTASRTPAGAKDGGPNNTRSQ